MPPPVEHLNLADREQLAIIVIVGEVFAVVVEELEDIFDSAHALQFLGYADIVEVDELQNYQQILRIERYFHDCVVHVDEAQGLSEDAQLLSCAKRILVVEQEGMHQQAALQQIVWNGLLSGGSHHAQRQLIRPLNNVGILRLAVDARQIDSLEEPLE